MKYVNNYGLPEGIVNLILDDEYSIGKADYSFSNLLSPPQLRRLMQLHFDEIEVDVADEIWKVMGTAFHAFVAKADNRVILPKAHTDKAIETRFYMNVGDYTISGQMDKYNIQKAVIEDYKMTNMYKVLKADHDDWNKQLNVYSLLLRANGYAPKKAYINAILKDWSLKDKANYGENFPPKPFKVLEIPLVNPLDTLIYVIERIKAHEAVKEINDAFKLYEVAPCSEKDRWASPDRWIVKKYGGKRAVPGGAFDNEADAKTYQSEKGDAYIVEYQPGQSIRCERFCLVRYWCEQKRAREPKLVLPGNIVDQTQAIISDVENPQPISLFGVDIKKEEVVTDLHITAVPKPVGIPVPIPKPKLSIMDMFKHKPKAEPELKSEVPKGEKVNAFDPDALYRDLMKDIPKDASFIEKTEADKKAQWARLDAIKARGVVDEEHKPKLTIVDDVNENPNPELAPAPLPTPKKIKDDDVDSLLKDLLGKL